MESAREGFIRTCEYLVVGLLSMALSVSAGAAGMGEGSTQFTGLSNAVEANLLTGTASYSIPINIPPGRQGATPALALTYSSGGGDGIFGRGWGIHFGEITRSTKMGVPRCRIVSGQLVGPPDEFVLSMPGVQAELVRDASSPSQYFVRYDEGYLVATADTSNNQWTAFDRAGNQYVFGEGPNDRSWVGADVFNNQCQFTSRWVLKRIVAPGGSHVEMTYTRFNNVPAITSVVYGGNTSAAIAHPFEITFTPEDREYPFEIHSLGVPEKHAKLINKISVGYRPNSSAGSATIIREYLLEHQQTAFGGAANLVWVDTKTVGGQDELPRKEFKYSSNDVQVVADEFVSIQETGFWAGLDRTVTKVNQTIGNQNNLVVSNTREMIVDMNGDGLPDRVAISGPNAAGPLNWPVYLGKGAPANQGLNTWKRIFWNTAALQLHGSDETLARSITTSSLGSGTASDRRIVGVYATIDLTGDGIPDFVDASPPNYGQAGNNPFGAGIDAPTQWKVYPGQCTQGTNSDHQCQFGAAQLWDAPASYLSRTRRMRRSSNAQYWDATYVMLMDVNADGFVDYLETGEPATSAGWASASSGPSTPPTVPWRVRYGDGSRFGSEWQDLGLTGYSSLSHSEAGANFDSRQIVSLFDANGDGLADRVSGHLYVFPKRHVSLSSFEECPTSSGCVQANFVDVNLNTGGGFATLPVTSLLTAHSTNSENSPASLGFDQTSETSNDNIWSWSSTKTRQSFYDVNGDGLPDWVMQPWSGSGARVLYNVGGGKFEKGSDAFETFNGHTAPKRQLVGFAHPFRTTESRALVAVNATLPPDVNMLQGDSESMTVKNVVDVDGDGQLEVVAPWNEASPWSDLYWRLIRFRPAPPNAYDFAPGLLAEIREGTGVISELDYVPSAMEPGGHNGSDFVPDLPFNRWVVAATRRTDGLCDAPTNVDRFNPNLNLCIGQGHEIVRLFEYSNGKFDRTNRTFVGFGTVVETSMDGNDLETRHSQVPGLAGKVIQQKIYLGASATRAATDPSLTTGAVLRRTDSDWKVMTPALDPERRQIYLAQSSTIDYARGPDDPNLNLCSVTVNEAPDSFGRVSRTCTRACAVNSIESGASYTCGAVEGLETVTTVWADPTGASQVRERPREVTLTGIRGGISETISRSQFRYDGTSGSPLPLGQVGNGWVTQTSQYLDESLTQYAGGGFVVTEQRTYDAAGNVLTVTDANNKTLTNTYSASLFSLYMTSSAHLYANNLLAVTTYSTDLRFGKVSSTTSPNNDTAQARFDSLGRVDCEAQPGDSLANCLVNGSAFTMTMEREFFFGTPGAADYEMRHNRMVERSVEPNSSTGYVETITYIDGLGRPRFRKVQRVIDDDAPTAPTTVIEGQTDFDSEGRAIRQYGPYESNTVITSNIPSAFVATEYGPFNDLYHSAGVPVKDPLGRPRTIDPPDQTRTTHSYRGSLLVVENADGGISNEVRDAKDRVVETKGYDGAALVMQVNLQYDAAGREVWRRIANSSTTDVTSEFDSMGRKVRGTDPDAGGTWTYGYDYVGNLLYVGDPKTGQHTQSVYDDLSRLVRTCHYASDVYVANANVSGCGTGGTTEAVLAYDTGGTNMIGRLRSVSDPSGSTTYDYDDLGRVVAEDVVVSGHIVQYTSTYDRANHVKTIRYGSGGDVATYGYNAVGQPISLVATLNGGQLLSDHVDDIDYDVFGRIKTIFYANGVKDSKTYFGPDNGYRLQTVKTEKAGGTTHLNLTYAYSGNSLGKIGSIADGRNASGPLSRNATYTYDRVGRLNAVASAAVNGGYQFDVLGNLTSNLGQALVYNPGAGTAGPHHVDSYNNLTVAYDANGNRQSKARAAGGTESYTYDPFNRLKRIDVTGPGAEVVQFRHNHAGRKVTKQVGSAPLIRYFGDFVEKSYEPRVGGGFNEIWTKHFFIAGMRVSSARQDYGQMTPSENPFTPIFVHKEIVFGLGALTILLVLAGSPSWKGIRVPAHFGRRMARMGGSSLLMLWIQIPAAALAPGVAQAGGGGPQPNPVLYYHGDHLGSTQVVTDGAGDIHVQLRHDPYGKEIIRADASGVPIAPTNKVKHEFTGHEREHVTGLIDAGARFLDGELTQFLTSDPAGQFASPYAYGPGDPINGTDPDGEFFFLGPLLAFAAKLIFAISVAYAVVNLGITIATGNTAAIFGAVMGAVSAGFLGAAAAASPGVGLLAGGYGTYQTADRIASGKKWDVGLALSVAAMAVGVMRMAYSAFAPASSVVSGGGRGGADREATSQGQRWASNSRSDVINTDTGIPDDQGLVDFIQGREVSMPNGAYRGAFILSLEDTINNNVHFIQSLATRKPAGVFVEWFNRVKTGGLWDYKQRSLKLYEHLGNANYGATGRALGIPEFILLRAAGSFLGPRPGTPLTSSPYGDDWWDQNSIGYGIQYHEQRF